jgi:hypothetical protein
MNVETLQKDISKLRQSQIDTTGNYMPINWIT